MPRDGAMLLSDVTTDKLSITCECGLQRRYDVAELRARVGDTTLPELRLRLAKAEGCRRTESTDVYKRCQVSFTGLQWQ